MAKKARTYTYEERMGYNTSKPTKKPTTAGERIMCGHGRVKVTSPDDLTLEDKRTSRRIDAAIRRAVKECRNASPNPHHYDADGWKRIMAKYRVKL
jgi:hypothetical protein